MYLALNPYGIHNQFGKNEGSFGLFLLKIKPKKTLSLIPSQNATQTKLKTKS